MDFYNFYKGFEFDAHEYLGAHTYWGGTTFRTYAPSASRVSLIGDFSDWSEIPMERGRDGKFWEVSVPGSIQGQMYKYRIYSGNSYVDHADPYAFYSELRPGNASIIYDIKAYEWHDKKWTERENKLSDGPLNIYEMHFGSWRKKDDENPEGGWYSYEELGNLLFPYLIKNGYNVLEIMPLNEYPCDQSWGYQSTGYFSPTSRYGTPDELRVFIEKAHEKGIAVILDFIPVHFAVDGYGLKNYDGTALFEYPNNAVGYNEWGSCNFMHSRGETCSFLQSAANFWLTEYHFDGLRLDAVGNLIYWQGNMARGENKNALDFIKNMNAGLHARHPKALICAEDSTAYPGVTKPTQFGGLGFDYKWDLGWMNDTLSFFATAPDDRPSIYHKLTFSMMYFYNERFILPLSHDEVVHGKATIVQKMSDLYEGKFRQARAFYMYMYIHPGKKLNFMGNELGMLREWDETREQDWDILKYPVHDSFSKFMRKLNKTYLKYGAMSEWDYNPNGFEWVECHRELDVIYGIRRNSNAGSILALFNFSNYDREYELNLGYKCRLKPLLNSAWEEFGGDVKKSLKLVNVDGSTTVELPMQSAIYYEIQNMESDKKRK